MVTMYKRAAELNGSLKINSVLEEGTFIELDFKV
jgi:signal transduction histidine kinase